MSFEETCLWCGKPLPKRRRKYCSDDCSNEYFRHYIAPLWWSVAVKMAKECSPVCEECGSDEKLEVHHIIPLPDSNNRHNHKLNEQSNLRVLCRVHHEKAHHPQKPKIPIEQSIMRLEVLDAY